MISVRPPLIESVHVCNLSKSNMNLQWIGKNPKSPTQFILDPTSFNLTERIHVCDPIFNQLLKSSRDMCFAVHSEQIRQLKLLKMSP